MIFDMEEQKINFKSLKASCKDCSLVELCLPRGLNHKDLHSLDDVIKQRRLLQKNERIFNQGEKSGCIYAVRSGSVKTFTTAKNGEEQVLGFHLPGEILGLDGLDNHIHSCSGMALDTATICELPIDELNVLCVKIPIASISSIKASNSFRNSCASSGSTWVIEPSQ